MSTLLKTDVILDGCSTRTDGSLGLRLSTPELEPSEMTRFFQLRGRECVLLLQPKDSLPDEAFTDVKGQFDQKTPSQRMRSVLYLIWKQENKAIEFDLFYRQKMDGMIQHLKDQLEPT
jgi:hypothetical protein